jgi:hypothetical protein
MTRCYFPLVAFIQRIREQPGTQKPFISLLTTQKHVLYPTFGSNTASVSVFFCENCICFQFGRMLHPSLAASSSASPLQVSASPARRRSVAIPCAPNSGGAPAGDTKPTLKVGSPIVILEAPTMLKTAASVPSLRHNAGQVKPGDVGRLGAL